MCVVGLEAHSGGKTYTVSSARTEKIIVRASNPGQFDSDDVAWMRGHSSDTIVHNVNITLLFYYK